MGVKVVNKFILLLLYLTISNIAYGQRTKYLLFDYDKDSIISQEKTIYYKIDKNLFSISRYNEIDTISFSELNKIKLESVSKLKKEGAFLYDSILQEGIKNEKIRVIETNNQIFKYIYVIEKIPEKKYKKTRVWWIDYPID